MCRMTPTAHPAPPAIALPGGGRQLALLRSKCSLPSLEQPSCHVEIDHARQRRALSLGAAQAALVLRDGDALFGRVEKVREVGRGSARAPFASEPRQNLRRERDCLTQPIGCPPFSRAGAVTSRTASPSRIASMAERSSVLV